MGWHSHYTCDRCGNYLHVDTENELLAAGWLLVSHGSEDQPFALCTTDCLTKWSADVKLGEPILVFEVDDETEEDE